MNILLQNILPSDADSLARHTVAALSNNDVVRSVVLSQHLISRFPHLQEAQLLNAVAVSRLEGEHPEKILQAWDTVLRHTPLQPEYVAQALRLAWKANNTEYAARWLSLLEHTFLMPPPVSILEELEVQGWNGVGSVGIHNGKLHGWTWQALHDADGLPQITVSSLTAKAPDLHIDSLRRMKTTDRVLNIFSCSLPKANGSYSIRVQDSQGRQVCGSPAVCSLVPQKKALAGHKHQPVAIIIPVYADRYATLSCIGSVLASRKANHTPFEIVVVWDHGPDERLYYDLHRLAGTKKITLHTPSHNMGFLAAVNFALEQHPKQSVVLLNADTLVSGDWLDRLHQHGSKSGIGTVTPFGTHAELLSFPAPQVKYSISRLRDVRQLDEACKLTAPRESAREIPVGVGFCMYIPRAALDRLGGLDGHALFRGYGEEVEFCLRARKNGLRNVAACDVFVGHVGERSFGAGKLALAAQNNQYIFKHFPEYKHEYDTFISIDPLRKLREQASRAALRPVLTPLHIFIASDFIALESFFEASTEYSILVLQSCGDRIRARIHIQHGLPLSDMNFLLPKDTFALHQTLERFAPSEALIHSATPLVEAFARSLPFSYQHVLKDKRVHFPQLKLDAAIPGRRWIVPTPHTIQDWQSLCRVARESLRYGHTFKVLHLEKIWGKAPRPVNIWPALSLDELATCSDGLLILSHHTSRIFWIDWASDQGIPAYALCDSPEMREAICA